MGPGLQSVSRRATADRPEEAEIAVASLKRGKSVRVDYIPAELVEAGGETVMYFLTEICNRIW